MTLHETLETIADAIDATHDDCFSNEIRNLLIMLCNDHSINLAEFAHLDQNERRALIDARDAITPILDDDTRRDEITDTLLNYSLCPLHAIDYAICFDDQNAECDAIRFIHPSHDT